MIVEEILEKAVEWMTRRGWKLKLAKGKVAQQSLFQHSLIELDVFLKLLPILSSPSHYNLSETEQQILIVAVLVHDVGKETDEWQSYIRDPKPEKWVTHIAPELTYSVVRDLCAVLGFSFLDEPIQKVMMYCADLHHYKVGRSNGAILEGMLAGGSDRFLSLAQLIKAVDHCCSASSAGEARVCLESESAFTNHLKVAMHEVLIRGVSTTFIHRACQVSFEEKGWKPILYFPDATLYVADPNDKPVLPDRNSIRAHLKAEIDAAIARDVTALMVGSPVGNILPKPHLFSFKECRQYLETASKKVSAMSLARKPLKAKRKVVEDYWKLTNHAGLPTDAEVESEAARISSAQPEMLVFKFFKAMMDPEKIEQVGTDGAVLARNLYEGIFGPGSWAALQSTSTLMPAKDMARTIDYFWRLPGESVGYPHVPKVEELPSNTRVQVLINLLVGIADQVYAKINRPSPRDVLAEDMARAFISDLIQPAESTDVQKFAERQLEYYERSKPYSGKESAKGTYFCPICNNPFDPDKAVKASADFIDNPQTHTNRGVAHGSFGYVMVCMTCYYERIIIQILLGSRPAELIVLLPRLNFGPAIGGDLVRKVWEWVEAAKGLMRGQTGELDSGFSLGLIEQAARKLGDRDPFTLESKELLSLFTYRFTRDTQKKRRREALKRLQEEFDCDLDSLNCACSQYPAFRSWDEAVDALMENRILQQDFIAIRREVFRLYETLHLICRTPNMVFIPMTYEISAGNNESETSKALRRLYVSLVLSLVFDASVAILKEDEIVGFQGRSGAAFVPPVPSVRVLVGYDWVPAFEARRWLDAIGAASLLIRDTQLPERSALYQILASNPAERLARRIEENSQKNLTPRHLWLISRLPGFRKSC